MGFKLQDPDETLTHAFEWTEWLASGDTIASASFVITPTGPTVNDLGDSGTVSSAEVLGCTLGVIYRLTCSMVSTDGETGQQSDVIRCDHK